MIEVNNFEKQFSKLDLTDPLIMSWSNGFQLTSSPMLVAVNRFLSVVLFLFCTKIFSHHYQNCCSMLRNIAWIESQ
jgi:hypothetical protein